MGARLELVIVTGGSVSTHPLPEAGALRIGRGEDCDVRIDNTAVSRQHAILHLGPSLRIEDLGSANGTFVPDAAAPGDTGTQPLRRLSRASIPLAVGDRVNLGTSTLAVRRARDDGAAREEEEARDPAMRALYAQARRAAQSAISVLILGETGAGKEVLARAVHAASPRARGPFMAVNCGALTESLLESELFGHEKGSFTGAVAARLGLFEAAAGGTVFLDEIGELTLVAQVKLLRVLEDRTVVRVGGRAAHPIDVRFVSATHRDLEAQIERGAFRQDLYFRINGVSLTVPPLRARRGEIKALAEQFAATTSAQLDRRAPPSFAPETIAYLERHAWPGNVRELRNVVERAVVMCAGAVILPEDLPPKLIASPSEREPRVEGTGASLQGDIAAFERQRIIEALERCAGNQTHAAELLGISRRTLVARLGEYQIPRPRKRGAPS